MLPPKPIKECFAPASPASGMRSLKVTGEGVLHRLSRRSCELYSVQIVSSGSWGRAKVYDGKGRALWYQPSTFTGSFWLSGGADDGLLVELYGQDVNLTVNWREKDMQLV